MAIQHRRGIYDRFDPTRLVAGEFAIVLSNDPVATDGKAAYVCFAAGDVKRLATHEDMGDFLAATKDETVDYIVNEANAGYQKAYETIRDDAVAAEEERKENERQRKAEETKRDESEQDRSQAEDRRAEAEELRIITIQDFEAKASSGFFDGATFIPSVDEFGNLSWSNDKSLSNPPSVNIKGEKGNDGVVTQLAAGMYMFEITDGHLWLVYGDAAQPPDVFLGEDGHLWLRVEG